MLKLSPVIKNFFLKNYVLCVCVCFYKLKNDDCICFVLGFNDIYTTLINAIFSATYNFRLVRDIYIYV